MLLIQEISNKGPYGLSNVVLPKQISGMCQNNLLFFLFSFRIDRIKLTNKMLQQKPYF